MHSTVQGRSYNTLPQGRQVFLRLSQAVSGRMHITAYLYCLWMKKCCWAAFICRRKGVRYILGMPEGIQRELPIDQLCIRLDMREYMEKTRGGNCPPSCHLSRTVRITDNWKNVTAYGFVWTISQRESRTAYLFMR